MTAAAVRPYAELHCKSNFSFLTAASHPDELVDQAAALGYRALAITDRHSLAGIVRAHVAAKEAGLKLLVGAEIAPQDAAGLVLLATDRAGYGRLSRLLTVGHTRAPKGECYLRLDDVAAHAEGLLACIPLRRSPNQTPLRWPCIAKFSWIEPMPWPSCTAAPTIRCGWMPCFAWPDGSECRWRRPMTCTITSPSVGRCRTC